MNINKKESIIPNLTINDILEWCSLNDYHLIKKKKNPLSIEIVKRIAEIVCGLKEGEITKDTQQSSYAFARYLAITYLYEHYEPGKLAIEMNLHHTMISYALKKNLFDNKQIQFMTQWQQSRVTDFKTAIESIGGIIKQPKRITHESNK